MTSHRSAVVNGASRGLGLAFVRLLLESRRDQLVFATSRRPRSSPELVRLAQQHPDQLRLVPLDVTHEGSVKEAVGQIGQETSRIHLLLHCAGLLHDGSMLQPEKRLEAVEPEALRRVFEINAFAPLIVAKHFLPLLRHEAPAILANISARVGSIGDNRLGGWYAYRGSKAALNMFTRTVALELQRRAPNAICVALHPGTVDTSLSEPFQSRVPAEKLFSPDRAARQLLDVLARLSPEDTGRFLAWDASPIPW